MLRLPGASGDGPSFFRIDLTREKGGGGKTGLLVRRKGGVKGDRHGTSGGEGEIRSGKVGWRDLPDRVAGFIEEGNFKALQTIRDSVGAVPDHDAVDGLKPAEINFQPGIGFRRGVGNGAIRVEAARVSVVGPLRFATGPEGTLGRGAGEREIGFTGKDFDLGEVEDLVFSGDRDADEAGLHLALLRRDPFRGD